MTQIEFTPTAQKSLHAPRVQQQESLSRCVCRFVRQSRPQYNIISSCRHVWNIKWCLRRCFMIFSRVKLWQLPIVNFFQPHSSPDIFKTVPGGAVCENTSVPIGQTRRGQNLNVPAPQNKVRVMFESARVWLQLSFSADCLSECACCWCFHKRRKTEWTQTCKMAKENSRSTQTH